MGESVIVESHSFIGKSDNYFPLRIANIYDGKHLMKIVNENGQKVLWKIKFSWKLRGDIIYYRFTPNTTQ
jgi:hypothetical protein